MKPLANRKPLANKKPLASRKPLANEQPLANKNLRKVLASLLSLLVSSCLYTNAQASETEPATPESPVVKNVILIIGDGMDDQQISIARNYLKAPGEKLVLDQMPFRGAVQVLTVTDTSAKIPVYVADSANSASAMATGFTTSRGRISTSAGDDKILTTIVELAAAQGLKTGIVSTAAITDATPSAFAAHINFRFCESPDSMVDEDGRYSCAHYQTSQGGIGSISEQLAKSPLTLMLGGGGKFFASQMEDGSGTVLSLAEKNGFKSLTNQDQLKQSMPGQRLIGLFSDEHLATKLQGENGRLAEKPEASLLNSVHWSQGSVALPEPMVCEDNPEFVDTPPLRFMTEHAIRHLEGDQGFFLMIESASIDKQSHYRNSCGSIGEVAQLDETLALALDYASSHPDTLILVTADHGQAAQIIPHESMFNAFGVPVFTPGSMVRLKMPNGGIMGINYATNDFFIEEHSGVAVPLFSNQDLGQSAMLIKQSEIFRIIKKHLDL